MTKATHWWYCGAPQPDHPRGSILCSGAGTEHSPYTRSPWLVTCKRCAHLMLLPPFSTDVGGYTGVMVQALDEVTSRKLADQFFRDRPDVIALWMNGGLPKL